MTEAERRENRSHAKSVWPWLPRSRHAGRDSAGGVSDYVDALAYAYRATEFGRVPSSSIEDGFRAVVDSVGGSGHTLVLDALHDVPEVSVRPFWSRLATRARWAVG